jgi:hypothetical protein
VKWIEEIAQDRAKAAGDQDWERKMADMKRTEPETKGHHEGQAYSN